LCGTATVDIAIRPAIQAVSDNAGRETWRSERLIYRRVADRALDSHRLQLGPLENTGNPDYRIQAEQTERRCRIVKIHGACFDLGYQIVGQCVDVCLQAQRSSGLRTQSLAHASQLRTRDDLMELQHAAPKVFVAKRLEAECLFPFGKQGHLVRRVIGLRLSRKTAWQRGHQDYRSAGERSGAGRCAFE
jgi:hypothetical protein